ncbi:hypothetical protein AB1Y20_009666 [Prymnesium parvum]|uniref:Rab-GAP TBC domain-containing protein n=1 Tax=Prymnesium parvum TaxID=97485 RepID=A0AB34K6J5_PRYPA
MPGERSPSPHGASARESLRERWRSLSQREDVPPLATLEEQLVQEGLRQSDERQVDADTPRSWVAEAQVDPALLRRLLRAWCALRPDVGYTQSMNFVGAVALHVCDGDVEEAFSFFVAIMGSVPLVDFYAEHPPLRGFQIEVEVLLMLLEERHPVLLANSHVGTLLREAVRMAACPWLLNQWVNTLPIELVLRIWEMALCAPPDRTTSLAVALALLDSVIAGGRVAWTDGEVAYDAATAEWVAVGAPCPELEGGALYAALAEAGRELQDGGAFLEVARRVEKELCGRRVWSMRVAVREALQAEEMHSLEVPTDLSAEELGKLWPMLLEAPSFASPATQSHRHVTRTPATVPSKLQGPCESVPPKAGMPANSLPLEEEAGAEGGGEGGRAAASSSAGEEVCGSVRASANSVESASNPRAERRGRQSTSSVGSRSELERAAPMLTPSELHAALALVKPEWPTAFCETLFDALDVEKVGAVQGREVLVALSALCVSGLMERLKLVFEAYDSDGNGLLQVRDLLALSIALCKLQLLATAAAHRRTDGGKHALATTSTIRSSANAVLRQFLLLDTHGRGRLSLASFCQGILAQPQLLQSFTLTLRSSPRAAEVEEAKAIKPAKPPSKLPWVQAMLGSDSSARSLVAAEHVISAVFLGRADLLTRGVLDALFEDGARGGVDVSLREDERGNWVFAGYTFPKRSLLPLPLPHPPALAPSASPEDEARFVGAFGFPSRELLRGHATARNFCGLAAGDTLLELTLKSRGPTFKSAASKLELLRRTLDALLRLMPHDPYARLYKLARAIGPVLTRAEAPSRFALRFGRAVDGPLVERYFAATDCLADWLRPLVDSMPVPFHEESIGQRSAAMLIRARLDFVYQLCEAKSPASSDPALQVVVCPGCGQRTRHMACERCAHPLHEVKAAWVAAQGTVSTDTPEGGP